MYTFEPIELLEKGKICEYVKKEAVMNPHQKPQFSLEEQLKINTWGDWRFKKAIGCWNDSQLCKGWKKFDRNWKKYETKRNCL